jgi:hypothetical protein
MSLTITILVVVELRCFFSVLDRWRVCHGIHPQLTGHFAGDAEHGWGNVLSFVSYVLEVTGNIGAQHSP